MTCIAIPFDGNREMLCERVNPKSKKGIGMLHRWRYSDKGSELTDVYAALSRQKLQAWDRIKKEQATIGGEALRITGANTYQFSCAYSVTDKLGQRWLIYHTSYSRYAIPLGEING